MVEEAEPAFSSGFVAVVGRPNVGKSTLVNTLTGAKVAITSDRPQTTRGAVRGIITLPRAQVVFIDTPGYHKPRTLLGHRLNSVVRSAWAEVELALLVVDGHAGVGRGDERVARDLDEAGRPVICVVNKIDLMRGARVAQALQAASKLGDFAEYVPVSARSGDNVEVLRDLIVDRMPSGPLLYPEGTRSDQPPTLFVAELLREKLLARVKEEVPHSIAVVTEDYEEQDNGVLRIAVRVFVERESQKGIVIGSGGQTLKAAGTEAREEIEALFGRTIFLDTRVRVERDWQRRPDALERLVFPGGS